MLTLKIERRHRRTDGIGLGQSNSPRENKKIVTQTILMPLPSYVTVMYSVTLRSEYVQQINDMIQPFITRTKISITFS